MKPVANSTRAMPMRNADHRPQFHQFIRFKEALEPFLACFVEDALCVEIRHARGGIGHGLLAL